jgi:hypothetical protein
LSVKPEDTVEQVCEAVLNYLRRGAELGDVAEALAFEVKDLSLVLAPDRDTLALKEHRAVLDFWLALPQVQGVADVVKIDPHALRPVLGYLMLVDVVGKGPNDFRYALYGSKIAAVSGFDMTGKTIWDVATTSAIKMLFVACYRAVRELRRPLYTVHKAPPNITTSHWHRLILPLGQGGEVKRFLVCNTPIQDGRLV